MTSTRPTGFTLIELMIVVTLVAVLAAVAAPMAQAGMARFSLISASQHVASTIRSARFQAISKNRRVRVRFNCPAAGQYRVVEVVQNAAVDNAANRCDEGAYPYPAPNQDPATVPNLDSARQFLPAGAQFNAIDDLEFDTDGRMTPLAGCPTCGAVGGTTPGTIIVSNGDTGQTRTITVSRNGRIQLN